MFCSSFGAQILEKNCIFKPPSIQKTRPVLKWPNNAKVALCVVISMEHYEWGQPENGYKSPAVPGLGGGPFPDIRAFSLREYGPRVGIFRLIKVLEKYGLKGTVAVDKLVAENFPFVVKECQKRGYEFIGHGMSLKRMITSKMSDEEERAYIKSSIEAVTKATGARPRGWLGIEYGESFNTPELLAEQGIEYNLDWPNDEQPYRMNVSNGVMYSLPVSIELEDTWTNWTKHVYIVDYGQMIEDTFDCLYKDGADSGRLMVLNLHPWLIGQPYRIKYLDKALKYIASHNDVWSATGSEIIDWYANQQNS